VYRLIRSLLFRLPAEFSHDVALKAMRLCERLGVLGVIAANTKLNSIPKTVMGIEFPHTVGLAAGLDKNADYADALQALGFGWLELGTVTPRPQPGNPKPRMFRLASDKGIINRLGFNNKGIDHLLSQLASRKRQGIVGINIGKNAVTQLSDANEDYLIGLRKSYPVADYIAINISSPNTPGLRSLQYGEELDSLLGALVAEREALQKVHARYVPLAVKLAPDMSEDELTLCCSKLLAHKIDGVIATNTTFDRERVAGSRYAGETGGLSGAPLTDKACSTLAQIKRQVGDSMAIIGVGGIMTGRDAAARLEAGADLIQLYSGFIYEGPALIESALKEIADASGSASEKRAAERIG
jgi:dihydroorotate dehydrogenase